MCVYKKTNSFDIAQDTILAAKVVTQLVELHPGLNVDWLITGRGSMLYMPAVAIPEDMEAFADMIDDIENASSNHG